MIAVKDDDGTWKELIFADHQDPEDWVHCLRINENGIGFSSDGGTTYTQAWTLDGKLVIGGTNVPSITVYDSNQNIIFKADATAMVWNAQYSNMTANGQLFLTEAQITGGTITQTGNNYRVQIKNGRITAYPASGTTELGRIVFGDNTTSGAGRIQILGKDRASIGNLAGTGYVSANNDSVYIDVDDELYINGTAGYTGNYVSAASFSDTTFNYISEIHDNGGGSIGWTQVTDAPIVTGYSVTTRAMVHGIGT